MAKAEKRDSVFVYQYGDADNVSAPGRLLLRGECSEKLELLIRAACESYEYFVAEQIGVPTLYTELYELSDGPTIDDIAFHEFLGLRPATPDEVASLTCRGKLYDFVGKFCSVRYWDCTVSPHCG